ncbi:unnamed protein product [Pleuronectes platessa]|uniref:Uncharacterized protein n=1 Tax=Pleuronectes platessa TaxID=8262 RepID=A0A9N7YXQ3_PLEPL|nr:unnamed protein product [Pleuronectes platessa]
MEEHDKLNKAPGDTQDAFESSDPMTQHILRQCGPTGQTGPPWTPSGILPGSERSGYRCGARTPPWWTTAAGGFARRSDTCAAIRKAGVTVMAASVTHRAPNKQH